MENAIRRPVFIAGIPLVVSGFSFGVIGLADAGAVTFAYMAPGLLLTGVVLMVAGWRSGRR
jgi:hypothetical protein